MVNLLTLFSNHAKAITLNTVLGDRSPEIYPTVVQSLDTLYGLMQKIHASYSSDFSVNMYDGFIYPDSPVSKYHIRGMKDGQQQELFLSFVDHYGTLIGTLYRPGYESALVTTFNIHKGIVESMMNHVVGTTEDGKYIARSGTAIYNTFNGELCMIDNSPRMMKYLDEIITVDELLPIVGENK